MKVRDAERAFAFYQYVFGAVAVYRERGFIQAQTPGAWDVLVLEEQAEAGGGSAAGVSSCPGGPYLFCRDPDGLELEIWYELPTTADPVPDRSGPNRQRR